MPPKTRITKELILQKSFDISKNEGIQLLNARYLAKQLSCSTMPIFKSFQDMDELKKELKHKIDEYYSHFIHQYTKDGNNLFNMSYAYMMFALEERNLFGALFINELTHTRSLQEVIDSKWNRETIENTAIQYHISIQDSEILYRDIRFYCHGIATQLYGKNIVLSKEEIRSLLHNAIEKFLK